MDWIFAPPADPLPSDPPLPLKPKKPARATTAFERRLTVGPVGKHILRLYVAGATARSREAVLRVRKLCEIELAGDYDLEVIDVYQQPILARDGQIVATPTLVREFPLPVCRLIGDLTAKTGLFVGLDVGTRGRTAP